MGNRYCLDIHPRRSMRMDRYDYTQAGIYFVTIVAQARLSLFGEVVGDEMRLNDAGEMVHKAWERLSCRFPGIEIDTFVVMPNHIHGIIVVNQPVEARTRGTLAAYVEPSHQPRATTRVAPTLGDVVGAYKSITTVEYIRGVKANAWTPFPGRLWQRNYYDHIVRNNESLTGIRQYILDNPAKWAYDLENPSAIQT